MIEFTEEQEIRAMRKDCRVWTSLMVDAWYSSGYLHAHDYPSDVLVSHLKKIFYFCQEKKVASNEHIVLLTFLLLRANSLRCSPQDLEDVASYFLHHAKLNNIDYAKQWIDFYLGS